MTSIKFPRKIFHSFFPKKQFETECNCALNFAPTHRQLSKTASGKIRDAFVHRKRCCAEMHCRAGSVRTCQSTYNTMHSAR